MYHHQYYLLYWLCCLYSAYIFAMCTRADLCCMHQHLYNKLNHCWLQWERKPVFPLVCYHYKCDLHIGFRVHAHIYNLSKRNRSILLEEDGRGAGVNQSLGLSNIRVYDEVRQYKGDIVRKIQNRLHPVVNNYLQNEIIRNLERCAYTDWLEYRLAFLRMEFYYNKMCNHLEKIKEW